MIKHTYVPLSVNDTTVFEQLKKEHDDLKELLIATELSLPEDRRGLLHQICEELIPHSRGEEKTLYAILRQRGLRQSADALEIANEGYEEHRVADELLSNLKRLDVRSERWIPMFKVFKDNVLHHMHEEEHVLWAETKKLFSFEEQKKLLELYMLAKFRYSESLPEQREIRAREPLAEVTESL